jgi:Ca2+-binding RTX toxin-like protein
VYGSYYADRIAGNAAANELEGYNDADTLSGGGGADRFAYYYRSDTAPAAPDRILDFSHSQGDKIDLYDLDANEQVSGNQAFQFIGDGQFRAASLLIP